MKVDKSKWVETAFAKIATSQLGKTLDANKNKGLPYPYLCAANVGMGYFNLSNVKEILLEDSELEKYLVRKGDLLICEGGDTGRCAIWESKEPIYYQNALHRVRFNDDIHNKFIMYYLHYYKKVGIIDKLSHGQTIKHFTQKGLNKLSFRIPTISEQIGIASEIDAIQTMINGYKEQLADLDNLALSIFHDMFGDPITNPKGWEKHLLENKCKTSAGGTPSKNKTEYYENGTINWLRSGEVNKHHINSTELKITKLGLENSSAKIFPINTVVVAMYGATAGQVGVLKIETSTNQAVCGVLPSKDINEEFLYYCLLGLNSEIIKQAGGAAQPNISQGIIKALQIPIPPIVLQQTFATQVEAIEKQKTILREQLTDAEMLMAERMQYYFS